MSERFDSINNPSRQEESADEKITESWRNFFKTNTSNVPQEKMSLYAMGKLTQIALVYYIRLREIYPEDLFVRSRFNKLVFYTFNLDNEHGARLNEIVRSAGSFINLTALKELRFQLFTNPDRPNEVGEELHFQFFYGREQYVELNLGDGEEVIDMTACTFETFLRSFGEILGRIRAYCENLLPIPFPCEKRFRTSFCKKLSQDVETGPFNANARSYEYAQNIKLSAIGKAALREVALGAVLRTSYLPAIEQLTNERISEAVRIETDNIFERDGEQEHDISDQNVEEDLLHSTFVQESEVHMSLLENEDPILNRPIVEEQQQENIYES